MPFGDAPQPPEPPRSSEVKHEEMAEKTRQALSAEATILLAAQPGKLPGGQKKVEEVGQIKEMSLPAGWAGGEAQAGGVGTRSLRQFNPAAEPDAKLCLYYRGLPEDPASGQAFRTVLEKPPHRLDSDERQALAAILGGRADASVFAIDSLATADINGRRVLVLEGSYRESGARLHEIFVDAGKNGRVVQEIYFQAPAEKFARHAPAARAAIGSIKWK